MLIFTFKKISKKNIFNILNKKYILYNIKIKIINPKLAKKN